MELGFDLKHVKTTVFGVGLDLAGRQEFRLVPVGSDVQTALREMAGATVRAMLAVADEPSPYEPAEKYASQEHLYVPLEDELAATMRDLYGAESLTTDSNALSDHSAVFCYFARFSDGKGGHLLALRRATQFKGVLKSRLIRLIDDSMRMIEDKVFKLDQDFDLLIDGTNVRILRPSGFEAAGQLQEAILAAVDQNIQALQDDLSFVDLTSVAAYAGSHPRAARYLASIRTQGRARGVSQNALVRECKRVNVDVQEADGVVTIADGHAMGFLEVLDRRRYELELVEGSREQYRAASRTRLPGAK